MRSFTTKSSRPNLLAICAIVCLCCVSALAQDANEPTEKREGLTDLEQRMQKVVCVDVNEVPIGTVIRQLADQVDVDLIKSPAVTGNVTVSLTDVSLEEALRCILDVHGAGIIVGENVIRILSREEMPEISERLVTKTFEIIYTDVAQVVKALEKFKSAQGSVSFIQGTSHIIVTDTESKVRDIAGLIDTIDRITPQILVEVRIYDITSKDNFDLGIEWGAGRRTRLDTDSSIMNDDIGVEKGGDDTYLDSRTEPALMAGFEGATNKTADSTLGFLRFGVLNESINLDAQLRAEQENIDAKLLANPRILVLDNEEALFDIVTEHPYIERTITAGTITETVKFKNVGVKLTVTPHVARDGMLRLNIAPEFGIVVGQVQISSSNVPIVDTRKVNTIALVRDGQAVVLGGLRKKDTTKQTNKVPMLGDLPLLGGLFRFEGENTVMTELVVFITPRIVIQPTLSEVEEQALELTEFSGPKPVPTKGEARIARE
ncbi:MAG: type II secretion system protein GspD [Planctomycetota bacterium]|jgi:type IV pilus assembly protein PilQ